MISTAVIIFRETLEIVMILGVILAATSNLRNRARWIALGVSGGVMGAALVAMFADALSASLSGVGQELFNAGVMFVAASFIGWTAIWVRTTARATVEQFKQAGQAAAEGRMPLYMLSAIIGLSILREGSEIALFLYSLHVSGQTPGEILAGTGVGIACGVAVGLLFYLGMVRMPAKFALNVTSWMLILLVAGLAAQGVGYLSAAGYLSGMSRQVWNTSWLLTENSVFGKVLHGLVGYTARPTLAQVLMYLVTCLGLAATIVWIGVRSRRSLRPTASAVAGLLALNLLSDTAQALDTIDTPYVVQGELSVEYSGSRTFDRDRERDGIQEHGVAIEYGFTSFMLGEVKAQYAKDPNESSKLEMVEVETRIQVFEPGEHWLDLGVLLNYGFATLSQSPDAVEAKLLLAHDSGRISHVVDLGASKDVGRYAEPGDPSYSVLWNSRYRCTSYFQPGIEYQADLGQRLGRFSEQEHYLGPAVYGRVAARLNYQASFAWGISDAASDFAARLMIEYELHPRTW